MNDFRSGWYLIYTKPRHEKRVSVELSDISMNYFLPTTKKLSNRYHRRKYVDVPLFPSYIFVYLKDKQDYFNGLNIESVLYYVRSGKQAACVQESVVNNIQLMVNKGGEIEVSEASFTPGQQIVIKQGPLTGLSGEVVQVNGLEKIMIRVHLLQRNLLMTIPSESLMAVSS